LFFAFLFLFFLVLLIFIPFSPLIFCYLLRAVILCTSDFIFYFVRWFSRFSWNSFHSFRAEVSYSRSNNSWNCMTPRQAL
jgi:hypothetical protein